MILQKISMSLQNRTFTVIFLSVKGIFLKISIIGLGYKIIRKLSENRNMS